jgi:hypothetical protein
MLCRRPAVRRTRADKAGALTFTQTAWILAREVPQSTLAQVKAWHDETVSALLFVIGLVLLAAGLWLDRSEAVNITLLVLGVGLLAIGALVPRIEGQMSIGARGVAMQIAGQNPLAEAIYRVEDVRETAAEAVDVEAADDATKVEEVEKAVGRAWLDLFPTAHAVTASVAGSTLAPTAWVPPDYSGGAALPLRYTPSYSKEFVIPSQYSEFLKRLEEPRDDFKFRVWNGIHGQAEQSDDPDESP